jgi:glycosyltransferase involved in cell wall biosynthesis
MGLRIVATDPDDFRARVVIPLPARLGGPDHDHWRPAVDIVAPVHNQQAMLESSIRRLHEFLLAEFPFSVRITIADDASTDGTRPVAERLAAELSGVRVLRINPKGRGRALAAAWLTSEARVVAYLDLDAMSDLATLPALVAPVVAGRCDLSVGRPVLRRHHALLRLALRARFPEPHRGLQAMRAGTARRLIPDVAGRGWFFDTELLTRAEQAGLRIHVS